VYSLGIELAKTMSLNYSNQETSVTVGESVRDEDGMSGSFSKLSSCIANMSLQYSSFNLLHLAT
jgi:hypothetical protein